MPSFAVKTNGNHAPSIRPYETWFRQFRNVDFKWKNSARSSRPPQYNDERIQDLLDSEQTKT